jgi:hypothetical protein
MLKMRSCESLPLFLSFKDDSFVSIPEVWGICEQWVQGVLSYKEVLQIIVGENGDEYWIIRLCTDYAFHQLVKQRRLVMKLRSTFGEP